MLAAKLGVATDNIEIESGHSSPSKVVAINGLDDDEIKDAFE
jgi:uncharacterized protein YggU (UPF0235/DUF167 family)